MNKVLIFMPLLLLSWVSLSYAREIPFTEEDRDRMIRLETKLEEGFKRLEERFESIDRRIDDTNRRIDDLRGLVYVVISGMITLVGGMIALVGFVMWDRRTALAPAIRRTRDLEEREERIERALKELARQDPKVAEILRNVGLL